MPSSTITLTAADGFKSSAYVSAPSGKPKGAIVVIQEIFGVNQVMRDITDGLAVQGYLAICPDLFWRTEPCIHIIAATPDVRQRAVEPLTAAPAPTVGG